MARDAFHYVWLEDVASFHDLTLSRNDFWELNDMGETLLTYACWYDRPAMVGLLLRHGAPLTDRNQLNDLPMHVAVRVGAHECYKQLKVHYHQTKTADQRWEQEMGYRSDTVWHIAVRNDDAEALEMMYTTSTNMVFTQTNDDGLVPIQLAVVLGKKRAVMWFWGKYPQTFIQNYVQRPGISLFMLLAASNRYDLIQSMLWADTRNEIYRTTAWHAHQLAQWRRHTLSTEVLQRFLNHDPEVLFDNEQTDEFEASLSPLNRAIARNEDEHVYRYLDTIPDVIARDREAPLALAIRLKRVRFLVPLAQRYLRLEYFDRLRNDVANAVLRNQSEIVMSLVAAVWGRVFDDEQKAAFFQSALVAGNETLQFFWLVAIADTSQAVEHFRIDVNSVLHAETDQPRTALDNARLLTNIVHRQYTHTLRTLVFQCLFEEGEFTIDDEAQFHNVFIQLLRQHQLVACLALLRYLVRLGRIQMLFDYRDLTSHATILHKAMECNFVPMVCILLYYYVVTDTFDHERDLFGYTPFVAGAVTNSGGAVGAYLQAKELMGQDVFVANVLGALEHSARLKHDAVHKMLRYLWHDTLQGYRHRETGDSIAIVCAKYGSVALLHWYQDQHSEEFVPTNKMGQNALHALAKKGHPSLRLNDAMERLLDPLQMDVVHDTPVGLAVQYGNFSFFKKLMERYFIDGRTSVRKRFVQLMQQPELQLVENRQTFTSLPRDRGNASLGERSFKQYIQRNFYQLQQTTELEVQRFFTAIDHRDYNTIIQSLRRDPTRVHLVSQESRHWPIFIAAAENDTFLAATLTPFHPVLETWPHQNQPLKRAFEQHSPRMMVKLLQINPNIDVTFINDDQRELYRMFWLHKKLERRKWRHVPPNLTVRSMWIDVITLYNLQMKHVPNNQFIDRAMEAVTAFYTDYASWSSLAEHRDVRHIMVAKLNRLSLRVLEAVWEEVSGRTMKTDHQLVPDNNLGLDGKITRDVIEARFPRLHDVLVEQQYPDNLEESMEDDDDDRTDWVFHQRLPDALEQRLNSPPGADGLVGVQPVPLPSPETYRPLFSPFHWKRCRQRDPHRAVQRLPVAANEEDDTVTFRVPDELFSLTIPSLSEDAWGVEFRASVPTGDDEEIEMEERFLLARFQFAEDKKYLFHVSTPAVAEVLWWVLRAERLLRTWTTPPGISLHPSSIMTIDAVTYRYLSDRIVSVLRSVWDHRVPPESVWTNRWKARFQRDEVLIMENMARVFSDFGYIATDPGPEVLRNAVFRFPSSLVPISMTVDTSELPEPISDYHSMLV